ncbi:winged helix-turn-helix transcriptional regulator [Streptomyces spinoverrucosus]|nr:winged helix-turn-helix transcriptional regulator [Streptomyces spinoverrucosus]
MGRGPIRCRVLLLLRDAPSYPADPADALSVSRTRLSNHLACLRYCGLVVAVLDGRRTRYGIAWVRSRLARARLTVGRPLVDQGAASPRR